MRLRLMMTLSLVTTLSFGQQGSFDFKDLRFGDLEYAYFTTEQAIVKSLGQGKKVLTNEDDYSCGLFYSDSGEKYYHINYDGFNFTGNERVGFFLENINFDADGKIKITYKDKVLSGFTTKDIFFNTFNDVADEYFSYPDPNQDIVLIYTAYSETGAQFTFKNGRLIKFRYWYLC